MRDDFIPYRLLIADLSFDLRYGFVSRFFATMTTKNGGRGTDSENEFGGKEPWIQKLPCERYRVSLKRMTQRDILALSSQDNLPFELLSR